MSLAKSRLQASVCYLCRASASTSFISAAASTSTATFSTSIQRPAPPFKDQPVRKTSASSIAQIQDVIGDAAKKGAAPGSQVFEARARIAAVADGTDRTQTLYQGKSIRPGDLNYKRMYPALAPSHPKSILSTTTMGPGRKRSLETDFYLNRNNLNPLNEPLNASLQSRFVTNMGKVMNRAQTQLTWKNQRRMGKAVRRARAMGVIPYFADWSELAVAEGKAKKWGMWRTNM